MLDPRERIHRNLGDDRVVANAGADEWPRGLLGGLARGVVEAEEKGEVPGIGKEEAGVRRRRRTTGEAG